MEGSRKKITGWRLCADELHACPVFSPKDTLDVLLPEARLKGRDRLCTMPLASFLPIALEGEIREGSFDSGFESCHCTWSFHPRDTLEDAPPPPEFLPTPFDPPSLAFMQRISTQAAHDLVDRAFVLQVKKDTTVLRQGARSESFFVLQSGRAGRSIRVGGDDTNIMQVLHKGDCFGEASLLTGRFSPYSITALTDCTLLRLPGEEFRRLLELHSVTTVTFYRLLAESQNRLVTQMESLSSPELSGDLSTFGFVDLAQIIHGTRRSGLVRFEGSGGGVFGFREGRLAYATLDGFQGLEALVEAVKRQKGKFRFLPEQLPDDNLEGDTTHLLLEALRRLDETGGFAKQHSNLEHRDAPQLH